VDRTGPGDQSAHRRRMGSRIMEISRPWFEILVLCHISLDPSKRIPFRSTRRWVDSMARSRSKVQRWSSKTTT
jgi:hypothetical protein